MLQLKNDGDAGNLVCDSKEEEGNDSWFRDF